MALDDPHAYAHHLAAQYNAQLARDDIEWAVNSQGGLYLRDRPDWTRRHTDHLARSAERERRIWLHNNQTRDQ